MPTTKLTCPHCGHDGTAETSRPPLSSFGFNYLAEGIVCREVLGYDEAGRIRLSGDFKCEGPPPAGARIECRSCWRSFSVPEGLSWKVDPCQPPPKTDLPPPAPESQPAPAVSAERTAETISSSLLTVLAAMRQDLESASAGRLARIEDSLAVLTGTVEALQSLKSAQDGLRAGLDEQGRNLAELGDQLAELRRQAAEQGAAAAAKLNSIESALQAQQETGSRTAALAAELERGQEAFRRRMDAQAEVIRSLHAAAEQQIARREQIKAAVQRLEELAGGSGQVTPLPEEL